MSDETQTNENSENTEMAILKQRADTLGVKYSNNIGIDTLRERVNAAMEGETTETEDEDTDTETSDEGEDETETQDNTPANDPEPTQDANPLDPNGMPDLSKLKPGQRKMAIRNHLRKTALRLVRVRIANVNPAKKDLPGEVLTTGNKYIGTVKRFVPFGELTDDGWHIEQCLLDMMRERKFLQIRHKRDRRTGTNVTETRYVREFSIEELPPLTQEELDRLARTQAAAAGE